jgi:hypothetical protein
MTTLTVPRTTGSLRPLELFGTVRLLDEDERDIAATVRKFVETRLKPNGEDWFESATLPKDLAKEFGQFGVLGMHAGAASGPDGVRRRSIARAPGVPRPRPRVPDGARRQRHHLESVLTYEGTSEMHMLSIGKALTGQAAFR